MATIERGEPHQTEELLRSARAGDTLAWERLYERYRPELQARVRARLGPELRAREETMDLLQTVWLEAFSGLERFEYRSESSFLAWMTTVLRNKIATRLERARTVKRGGAPSAGGTAPPPEAQPVPEPGPSSRAEADEERERLQQALEELPSELARLVRWSALEGLPTSEIARRLGVSEGAARMRVARAAARLTAEFRRLSSGA